MLFKRGKFYINKKNKTSICMVNDCEVEKKIADQYEEVKSGEDKIASKD